MKKSGKVACHVVNSNIAIGSLPTLQISVGMLRYFLFEKIIMMFRFLPSFQISGRMYNTVVSIKCMMWKVCRNPRFYRYLQTIIECKRHKQGSLSSFRPPTGWGLYRFLWRSQREYLKGDLSNITTFNPLLFSLVDTFTVNSVERPDPKGIITYG